MTEVAKTVRAVTQRVIERSRASREAYLSRVRAMGERARRGDLSGGNLAHAFAASPADDKRRLRLVDTPNVGIVTAYNDMLSAHQPLGRFPELIKRAARAAGGGAQVAGGVPAMCDGITQGRPGMELSLLSRDVIAQATAVALSHDVFDAAMYLGVCDKIVPGLLIGALSYGHLPAVFCPAGPMTSGLPNAEKLRIRKQYAEGKIDREALLDAETRSYHGPGTCTFYGTANSNQMLMEIMGLHLPGTSFINPGTELRDALTAEAARRAVAISTLGDDPRPIGRMIDERSIVNAIVGLHATGGSTNHTIHLIAVAAAAGIRITWDDFADLSQAVPLLARIYPNGDADINRFHAVGGMAVLIRELLAAGLLHEDVGTIVGTGLMAYTREPELRDGRLTWQDGAATGLDRQVLRSHDDPFAPDGGLRVLSGALGRAVIKVSALPDDRRVVSAPARVFDDPAQVQEAFASGELHRDCVVVLRFQGPRANGMPELHRLTPALGSLQDAGHRVALVTDGRLSGASGKVPAAIHVSPEAFRGGAIARVEDGDVVTIDAPAGRLDVDVDGPTWAARQPAAAPSSQGADGFGRELFATTRRLLGSAEEGASSIVPGNAEDIP